MIRYPPCCLRPSRICKGRNKSVEIVIKYWFPMVARRLGAGSPHHMWLSASASLLIYPHQWYHNTICSILLFNKLQKAASRSVYIQVHLALPGIYTLTIMYNVVCQVLWNYCFLGEKKSQMFRGFPKELNIRPREQTILTEDLSTT